MSKVHDIITEKIITELQNGNIPWKRPWKTSGLLPTNLISKKAYRGINTLLLSLAGHESPYWVTFKQAKTLGGSVRKGEKGSMVVFYKTWDREDKVTGEVDHIPVMRYYTDLPPKNWSRSCVNILGLTKGVNNEQEAIYTGGYH